MTRNIWDISNEMKVLENELDARLRANVDEMRDAYKAMMVKDSLTEEEAQRKMSEELVRIAGSNSSNWSGGHSVTNLVEQAQRNAALEALREIKWEWNR